MKSLRRICILVYAAFQGVPQVYADEIRFRTIVESDPKTMIEATIFQGMPNSPGTLVAIVKRGKIAQKIDAKPCTAATIYFARPKFEAIYQYDPSEMYSCTDGPEITFKFNKRMVASAYEMFLNSDDPNEWGIDAMYTPAIKELKAAYAVGEVGKAVKLSSELSSALAKSGDTGKANAFRTLSLATTGIFVNSLTASGSEDMDIDAGLEKWNGRFEMTPGLKEKVVEFQSTCGASIDRGRVGWKTMSCLPGGADIQLRAYVPGSAVGG